MTSPTASPTLASLEAFAYLDDTGRIPTHVEGKVGIYAIFDQDHKLSYVGYSRDVYLSLKQHLVRQPQACHWIKVKTIDRPSRTLLQGIRDAWIEENGSVPSGNEAQADAWNQPIDAKLLMTDEDRAAYEQSEELGKIKVLKKVARRVEADILKVLEARGVKMDLRFNPKLKENGLLDLK
ncbi:MAG: GIY-YIG nuclease family protein [Leptolyngbyaceae cyanobacterium MO_188.B28]|nr:GIY-YIG nuclease family protein [Leptolyngbyaceae cyanobacterium MO_188.B28]